MIIDCHGHYTTAPKALELFRKAQIAALTDPKAPARSIQISDDEVRETLVPAQLKLQQERGTDIAIFSPGAGKMALIEAQDLSQKKRLRCRHFIDGRS
jgi:4-oxalmesaconate hydratase